MQRKPEAVATAVVDDDRVLATVRDLEVYFPLRGSFFGRLLGREAGSVKALDGISFELRKGEVLGLVGESGSGKTTLGRALLGLVEPTGGSIEFEGTDLTELNQAGLRDLRKRMQMVFQDPHASLNPAMDLATAVGHPLRMHGYTRDKAEIERRVAQALERVGLAPASSFMGKYPSDLSGGQKQRAALARAVILGPSLLVADEPVSMLDMSVRAKILELMLTLKNDLDLTYMYITHDLATAKFFCDRIAIMYLGRIVEIGPSSSIYAGPKHPYTVSLLKAIPEPDPSKGVPRDIPRGEIPDAINPPLGCSFHPRCPRAFEVCGWESRDLKDELEERWTGMSEEEYELERDVIGDIEMLEVPSYVAEVSAGAGQSGEDLLGYLQKVRDGSPDAIFWKGVRSMQPSSTGVTIRFHDGIDPPLLPEGDVEVACHLWDETSLKKAEEYAQASEPVAP